MTYTRQLQMFKSEFEEASFPRDLAAYGVVGCLEHVIHHLKRGDIPYCFATLESANAKYEKTAQKLAALTPPEKKRSRAEHAA